MPHIISLKKDVEYTDGKIKAGEYNCLYEEGELHFIKHGDYVVGIHSSLINTPIDHKKVDINVGSNRERI